MRAPKPPGWLARILAGVVLTQAALHLARPVTSYRALALGADARAVGLITAAFALVPLVVAVPLGRASDRWRVGYLLTGGIALGAVACVLLGLAGTLWGLALASAVLGLGHLALTLAGQSLIARQAADALHDRDFGLYTAGASLGQLIGPALAGARPQLGGGVPRGRDHPRLRRRGRADGPGGAHLVRHRPARAGRPGAGPRGGAPAAGRAADQRQGGARRDVRQPCPAGHRRRDHRLPAGPRDPAGIPPAVVGALLSLRAATSILSRLLIPWMVGRLGRVRLLAASAAGSALLTAALPLSPSTFVLAVLLAAAGFLLGIGQPLTMSMVVQAVPSDTRGTALAIRLTGNRFGQVATPAAAGLVAGAAGVSAAFWLLGGLLGLAALAVVRR